MIAACGIFLVTLVLVIWQPRGLGIGWSASLGALLALLSGVVQWHDLPVVWGFVWNATTALIAIIIITLLLDEAGFFEWSALHIGRWGKGRGRPLFCLIVLLGAATSAVFTNDGAVLILTPIVMAMMAALGYGAGAMLAFVMAAGFIADTASLPLVVSNLVNIVSADFFGIDFARYAYIMVPVNAVSVGASLCVLLLYFRRRIPERYDADYLREPRQAIRDTSVFRLGWWVLLALLAGFFILEPRGVPVSAVASAAAVILLGAATRSPHIRIRKVMREAPWHIVIFSLGMYLVVYGLRNAGVTAYLTTALNQFASAGGWAATLGTGILAAALASIMNNLPTVLAMALSIDASDATGVVREAMIYANIIGSDLGPKITPIGSLATLLWLHVLKRKGMEITWGRYFRIGVVLTVPVLLITLSTLALRLGF